MSKIFKTEFNPDVVNSELPLKLAASIAIFNKEGMVLIAKRAEWVSEFKGVWSLPSKFIQNSDSNQMNQTIQSHIQNWFSIKLPLPHLAVRRIAARKHWNLQMNLFISKTNDIPVIQTNKYTDFAWVDGKQFFSQIPFQKLGDCAKCYLQFIENIER